MLNFLNKLQKKYTGDNEDNITEEGADEREEILELTTSDDVLTRQIDRDIAQALPIYQAMRSKQDENEKYYLGTQLDKSRFSYELPVDQNVIYRNLETLISIITAKRREPITLAAQDTDESKKLKAKTQQYLTWKWHDEDMQIKFEDWVRHSYIYLIGVLKIRWDLEKDDYEIKNIRPQKILIDKDATDEYDAKFIVEFKEDTLEDLIDIYPKAKGKLTNEFGDKLGTKIKYIEYWTNEFTVIKVNKIVLDKKKNPNWNWDEKDRKKNLEKLKKKWIKNVKDKKLKNVLLNYFNEPRKPYVILSLKTLNKSIYSITNDFEQSKVGQDIVNRRKRQIDKATIHALGREVYSGDYITKEKARKSLSNPNAPVWVEKGKVSDVVTHISPQPVSPILLEDLRDSKAELDNTMGTHSTTRGERSGSETATGRTLLREGDMGRADLVVRRIDKKLELLYGWMLQMSKVYYTDEHFIKMLGKEGATSYLQFSKNDIEDGQEIIVKSELTVNKASQIDEMGNRLKAGLLDPLTYFEKMDDPNPKELARRLIFYVSDPKLYVNEFCVDDETEESANTPEGMAKKENKQLEAGEKVPPYEGVTKEHLEVHTARIREENFAELEIEIQNNYVEHIRAESELLKAQTQI